MTNEILGIDGTTARLHHPAFHKNSSLEVRPPHAPPSRWLAMLLILVGMPIPLMRSVHAATTPKAITDHGITSAVERGLIFEKGVFPSSVDVSTSEGMLEAGPSRASCCDEEPSVKLGRVGLGRMGANMVRRLLGAGHECVVFDIHPQAGLDLTKSGATATPSLSELVSRLAPPRAIWIMVPAAVVDATLRDIAPLLASDDVLIDGGNSYYHDDIRRAETLRKRGIHYVDVGTSGGVWGFERGYCQMIGGEDAIVKRLDGIFSALAPGLDDASKSPRDDKWTVQRGYIHCGPAGAGHFVKMVHNGIEYGMMAAYAEGLNILRHANVGTSERTSDAETAPLRHPELYQYDLNLPDIVETWRHGSDIGSWLLDLTAAALKKSPDLKDFTGRVSDSGEGRWTLKAAIDEGVPAPILSTALTQRFASRGDEDFANKMLSALRYQFGGHEEKT